MKIIKVSHKQDWGIRIKFFNFEKLKKLEFDDKFSSIKLCIDVEIIEGAIEKFDMEKFEKFIKSDERMIFEICVG